MATRALGWPSVGPGAQDAWWDTTALYPLQLCVPAGVLATAHALELRGGADLPTRRYALEPAGVSRPDLMVYACGSEAASAPRPAVLTDTTVPPDHSLDEAVVISPNGPVLTVAEVQVIGAAQDPQLPAEHYRVVVRVAAPAAVDWVALRPRLVLETGLELIPSDPVTERAASEMVEVAYLAPAWHAPMTAAWSVTDPRTDVEARWRVTLDPPRSRAAVLRDALDITVTSRQGPEPGSATVIMKLRNTSTTTLVLRDADVAVTQGERIIPVTMVGRAGLAINPGEARTLEAPLQGIDRAHEVNVRVGAAGFRLRLEQEGGAAPDRP